MGAFICQISERDWEISKRIGLYGNRERKPDNSGDLRTVDKMSVVRDLISIKPGDIVFFHVVKKQYGESTIHGLYEASSFAFYDKTKVWSGSGEIFPYRFLFHPVKRFKSFTIKDPRIFVSELYRKIEDKSIWSIATLENERNMERRAVRKIAIEDGEEIIRLILRSFKFISRKEINFKQYRVPPNYTHLEDKIEGIDRIENSIKAFLLFNLRENSLVVRALFGDVLDYMNETFVAQTTRKLFDLLVISKNNEGRNFYIVEAKTRNYTERDLSQLLNYLDLFKQKRFLDRDKDKVIGYTLAQKLSQNLVYQSSCIHQMQVFDNIGLIKYIPHEGEKTASFEKAELGSLSIDKPLTLSIKMNSFTTSESLFYSGDNFKRETSMFRGLRLVKVFMREDSRENRVLREYLYYKKHRLTLEVLIEGIQKLKKYMTEKKNGDYSGVTLVFDVQKMESGVSEFIDVYNRLLSRPPLLVKLAGDRR